MRAPLIIPNEAREDSRAKDSWGVNCFLEREDADRAVKRPGLTDTADFVGGGVGGGVFIWPLLTGPKIVLIFDDALFILETYSGGLPDGTIISSTEMIADGYKVTLHNLGGTSQFYQYAASNSYNDEVWMLDPDTGILTRYYAASPHAKTQKVEAGWRKHLWSKTPITTTDRWQHVGSNPPYHGEGVSVLAAGAASLARGLPNSVGVPAYPVSGVDGVGRSYTVNIDAIDVLPSSYQTISLYQPNPPYPGAVTTQILSMGVYTKIA